MGGKWPGERLEPFCDLLEHHSSHSSGRELSAVAVFASLAKIPVMRTFSLLEVMRRLHVYSTPFLQSIRRSLCVGVVQ